MSSYKHLTDYLELQAETKPSKPALVCEDKTLNWHELNQLSHQAGSILSLLLGTGEQKVVALLFPNSWQYVAAYLGVLQAGHIAMPIDVIYKPLEIGAIINQIKPSLIITDKANLSRIPGDKKAVITYRELMDKAPLNKGRSGLRLQPDSQIASLLFTSGTTGKPKAAPYTHANHAWNIDVCSRVWKWTGEDSLLISLRLSHWYGLVMGLSGALYHGNTMYLRNHFNAEDTFRMLSEHKISLFTHVAGTYTKLLEIKDASGYDLSRVRLMISGGAPLPPATWQQFKKQFGVEILEVYGSSESGRIASNLLRERLPGSPGRPLPDVQVKFSKEDELLVKSEGVFPGYYKNEALTAAGLTEDGWWHTGDIGKLENGRIVLKGRKQERIRRQGYTISPRDIEWALHSNEHVRDAFVMGLQSEGKGDDELIYFLVTDLSEEEIRQFCEESMPSIWRPSRIIHLNGIPRTRSGKAEIPKLKEMLNSKRP